MCERFFEIFEQDNPLALKYIYGETPINEGLIKTYPINSTIEYIKRLFGLSENQLNVISKDSIYKILVMFENASEKKYQMLKAMNLCGFELASERTENDKIIYQMYCQKFSENLTNELKEKMSFLMHVTPFYNKQKILQNGFIPKSKNELFTYGEEVFFFTQDAPLIHIVDQIYQKDCMIKNKRNNHIYTLFQVSLNKIPNEVKFEVDPNLSYAVRTKDNISPNTIMLSLIHI